MNARVRSFLVAATLVVAVGALLAFSDNGTTAEAAVVRFHAELSRAEPKVNDTVAVSPTVIKLWFTEAVKAAGTSVRITGPASKVVALGPVTVDTLPKSPAVAAVKEKLTAGTYSVEWKAMAADGHPSSGKFAFTFRPKGS